MKQTLRQLLTANKPSKVVKKLNQLNIGLSNTVAGAWASKWSIGYHEPTLDDVIDLKKMAEENSILLSKSVDSPLTLQLDWSRHFGECPTGPMM